MIGTVKWYNEAKGFGFISLDDGADVFVHISALKLAGLTTLFERQKVSFELIKGTTGKSEARNIMLL